MAESLTFMEKMRDIQQQYEANKSENNDFGGYAYRNIEKMMISLKPLLKKHDLFCTFSDTVENLGDRYYVKATVMITDGKNEMVSSAYAREEFEKKKSDASQLTGSASTYARKYALCGLLGVDDGSNDPDSKDNDRKHYKTDYTATVGASMKFATEKQINWMRDEARRQTGLELTEDVDEWIKKILTLYPKQVPLVKVKDAVDKIKQAGKAEKPVSNPDIVITDMPETISLEDLPY